MLPPLSSVSDSLNPRTSNTRASSTGVPHGLDVEGAPSGFANADGEEQDADLTPALKRVVVVAGLGGLLFGYDTGVCSGALLQIGGALGGAPLSTSQETGIVVSALWGALAGSLLASRLADWAGRKPTVLGAAVLFTIGALEQAAAQTYKEVILGRVMVGIAVGLASMVLPIYLAEISPPAFRGRIVGSLVVLITGGQVVAYCVTAAFMHVNKGWRWSFGLGAVPALLQLVLSFSIPESPRWLLRQGRTIAARRTLSQLAPHAAAAVIQRRMDALSAEGPEPTMGAVPYKAVAGDGRERIRAALRGCGPGALREGRLGALWRDRASRRALLVAMGLQWFQQATGFNNLMYFSGKIIEQTHLSQPAAFAIFIAVSNFVATLVALRLIDRVGRRYLLLRTFLGMSGGMALLALAFVFIRTGTGEATGASPWAFVALAAMVLFCAAYALGVGNVAWVVQAEVFHQDLRAVGNGLATAANWSGNLLVSSTFLHLSQALTPAGAFALFSLICVGGWGFTYLLLPETKGLSLEQVRALFEQQVGLEPSERGVRRTSSDSASAGTQGYAVVRGEERGSEASERTPFTIEEEDEADEEGEEEESVPLSPRGNHGLQRPGEDERIDTV